MSEWRAIPGREGVYEVSDQGQIRNASTGHIRRTQTDHGGHLKVRLYPGDVTQFVHRAVAAAFVGDVTGRVVRHLDGDPTNNAPSNLAIGTQQENILDSVRHGTHAHARKTHCVHGHEFTPENTRWLRGGRKRECRICDREHSRKTYARRVACAIEAGETR